MSHKLLKRTIRARVQEGVNDFWREKVGQYIMMNFAILFMQGDYASLLMEEGSSVTWGSYLKDIP